MMDLSDARQRLTGTDRHELQDHAFGDCEVSWWRGEIEVANGYFGSSLAEVSIFNGDDPSSNFIGEDARTLREEGHLIATRNDETGPLEYKEGQVTPGLSMGDVYHELTGNYLDGS